MGELKLVNLRIDSELWHQAKVEAVKQNIDLQDFVANALREKLSKLQCQTETTK